MKWIRASYLRKFGFVSFALLFGLYVSLYVLERMGKGTDGTIFSRDFTAYYVAGELVWQGRIQDVYDQSLIFPRVNALLGKSNPSEYYFLYPPFCAWLCAPLALFSRPVSALLFFCGNFALALLLARLLPRAFGVLPRYARAAQWLFLGSFPLWATLFNGQNGLISLLLASSVFLFHRQKHPLSAGLLLAVTLGKPQLFAGLYLWSLLWGGQRLWLGFFTGSLFLFMISLFAGLELWIPWWNATRLVAGPASNPGALYSLLNLFEFWSIQHVWTAPAMLVLGLWGFCGLSFVLSSLYLRHRNNPSSAVQAFALSIVASVVLTPRIYHYDLPLLFVGLLPLLHPSSKVPIAIPLTLTLAFYLQDLGLLIHLPVVPILLPLLLLYLSWTALRSKPEAKPPPHSPTDQPVGLE
jgi:hypothetical protein